MKVICDYCGKIILRKPHHANRGKHNFCSRKCYSEWLKTYENPFNHQINVNCLNCGKEMNIQQYMTKLNCGRFCSRKCQLRYKTKMGTVTKICPNCNKEFKAHKYREDTQIFCSRECNKEYLSEIRVCKQCGKEFRVLKSRLETNKSGNVDFCSRGCKVKYNNMEYVCEYCGVIFKGSRNAERRFCSWNCYLSDKKYPHYRSKINKLITKYKIKVKDEK